eukprot:TRINITY_DN10041_c0_g2_i1.p1 TRINITY_DN10041_c0_g2~~TRINITY_DN10041_c0_g2_i1.p1  ORF type:complete len:722 (-),score=129.35 TRINITY_DN10041_c0_g2_i1:123-2192(-)
MDEYYSSEEEEEFSGGEMEEEDMLVDEPPDEFEEDDEAALEDDEDLGFAELRPTLTKKYEVFDLDKVDGCRSQSIIDLNQVLNIGEDVAARVLRRFKWDGNAANESWFQDEEKFREELGILHQHQFTQIPKHSRCQVCYEESDDLQHCGCGHCMCVDCWHGYVTAAIESGPSVVDLRCFQQKCKVAVPKYLILQVCDSQQKQKLQTYDRQSFVDENPRMSWCSGGGCQLVIYCTSASVIREGGMLDVTCTCGESFCFQCKCEAHRPVDCKTVVEWLKKAGAESENLNYILANTKPCPKCKCAIEKNQGCNHMVCSQCKHQFCWLCQGDWAKHGEGSGGYYSCNKYDAAKRRGEYDETEMKRQHARESLVRYTHYFERYSENDKGMKRSMESVNKYKNQEGIEALSEKLKMEANYVKFLLDSWLQVVSCRRVLKWTYAFGYYRFDGEDQGDQKKGQKSTSSNTPVKEGSITQEFFEFLQGDAEKNLERLHSVLEKDFTDLNLDDFEYDDENPYALTKKQEAFTEVKQNLTRLTDITKNYFVKLVRALETGVNTRELQPTSNASIFNVNTPSQDFQLIDSNEGSFGRIWNRKPSNSNNQQQAPEKNDTNNQPHQQKANERKSRSWRKNQSLQQTEQNSGDVIDLSEGVDVAPAISQQELERIQGWWQCSRCTFVNELDAGVCAMCDTDRPR